MAERGRPRFTLSFTGLGAGLDNDSSTPCAAGFSCARRLAVAASRIAGEFPRPVSAEPENRGSDLRRPHGAREARPAATSGRSPWAQDDNLYTAWGDGGGFGGTDIDARVSLGVARIAGGKDQPRETNVAGGKDAPHAAPFSGKSEGLLALGNTLYLWRDGDGSDLACFKFAELWRSDDLGGTWRANGVRFSASAGDFPGGDAGFFAPAFCQFGRGYGGRPRRLCLSLRAGHRRPDSLGRAVARAHQPAAGAPRPHRVQGRLMNISQAKTRRATAAWTRQPAQRRAVWADAVHGTHRIAVSYNPG
ncbi:MAG: hypothetical protein WDM96_04675 [Lacunisphaera sp.]